jgi:hypothetical protein
MNEPGLSKDLAARLRERVPFVLLNEWASAVLEKKKNALTDQTLSETQTAVLRGEILTLRGVLNLEKQVEQTLNIRHEKV